MSTRALLYLALSVFSFGVGVGISRPAYASVCSNLCYPAYLDCYNSTHNAQYCSVNYQICVYNCETQ